MTKSLFLLLIALTFFPISIDAEDESPYVGRVIGNRVNVRAGIDGDSVVLTQLKKGNFVHVLSVEGEWLQIKPPSGTTFWVFSRLLRDGWPKSDDINVRSGPGIHYPAVCQVGKNTSIDIVEQRGAWTRINPPENSTLWISRDYVTFFASPEDYLTKLEVEEVSKKLFAEAESNRSSELRKKMEEINFEDMKARYQNILDLYPDTPLSKKISSRLLDIEAEAAIKTC